MKVRDEVWAHVHKLVNMVHAPFHVDDQAMAHLTPMFTPEQARKMLRVEISWEDTQSVFARMGGGEAAQAYREMDDSGNMRFSQDGVTYYIIPGMTGYKIINPMEKAR